MNTNYSIPTPIIPFAPPVYAARFNPKPFTLDGRLDNEFWADIPFTDLFVDIEGSSRPTPRFATRAKIAWDHENLYFGAILEGNEIWGNITECDAVIFYDNDFEIFIDPDSDTQQYYEFEMNAKNAFWDLLLTKAYHDGGKPVNAFDIKGIRTAVHIDGKLNDPNAENKFWSVEVVMPFTTLMECSSKSDCACPDIGDYWRMNFSRVQWKVNVENGQYVKRRDPVTKNILPEDNWVWSPTGVINIHYPEMWGFVFFADETGNGDFSIPQDEYRKIILRQIYYLQSHYLEDHGHYAKTLEELGAPAFPVELNLETTSLTYIVSCPDTVGTGTLYLLSDGKCGRKEDLSKTIL